MQTRHYDWCSFEGTRSWGECLGCPNVKCPSMELPFQSGATTEAIANAVTALREKGYSNIPSDIVSMDDNELAYYLLAETGKHFNDFKFYQALDAVRWGFLSPRQAAKYAGVKVKRIKKELNLN